MSSIYIYTYLEHHIYIYILYYYLILRMIVYRGPGLMNREGLPAIAQVLGLLPNLAYQMATDG